jgi:hypothetical protein
MIPGVALQLVGEGLLPGDYFYPWDYSADIVPGPDPAWYARFQITAGF